jgi:UDP-N-acetylmuramoyl-L-alanyl-D-glutamate--2,6-diaminopimelate ligase
MITAGELFREVPVQGGLEASLAGRLVAGIEYDSRRVEKDFLFFAFPGSKADGRQFAADAMGKGALAVASESPKPEGFAGAWIQVEHGRRALALVSRAYYGAPDRVLKLTGVTGTNGKTTEGYLVDAMLRASGKITGLVGTIEHRAAGRVWNAVNTTPESLDLHRLFAEVRAAGGTHVTMEVSSHALALGRVYAMEFHTAMFTNLSRDHLDFHPSMEDYFGAKRLLFEGAGAPPPKFSVLNRDDEWARKIPQASGTQTLWYGLGRDAEARATHISSTLRGLRFVAEYGRRRIAIESPLVGRINVYNILAACCAGISYGLSDDEIGRGIAACTAVPGRFERVDQGQPFAVVVDYAHTDDALRNTIAVARGLTSGRVITLFGCGGDRDRAKRPLMGQAAAEASDFVVLTSDNPRSEDPLAIMNDALVGLRRFDTPHFIEPDRAKAIRRAIEEARAGDVVILAGKGHETYQVLKNETIAFDDRVVAREVLKSFGYGKP